MFVVLAVLPVSVVYYFSLQSLQRGIDSWFDVRIEQALDDALNLSRAALDVRLRDVLRLTEQVAEELSESQAATISLNLFDLRVRSGAAQLSLLGSDLFAQFSNYNFTVFPMFLLAGSLAYATGMGNRLFDACYVALRRLPGNLVLGTTAACAGFAAICGSSTATAATLGKIALPVMKKYNYDEALATGAIAAGGCLGPLIPPSTVFIIYAILTEESIGQLFVAGIFPGILLTVLMVITVILLCMRKPSLAPVGPPTSRRQKLSGAAGLIEAAILFSFIMIGLSLGWFSPTQGGAAG